MRVAGVICEYNPLHEGHISQLKKIREELSPDYIIAAMSGDFVQRGEPAIYDKATRAKAALLAGADLVLEMPVIFATASAPDFAAAGVALLDRLGVVTDLCFGSECGDMAPLAAAADVLCDEPDIFKETLSGALRAGNTYPGAQSMALDAALKSTDAGTGPYEYQDIFSSPNNVLGIEYIKALKTRGSSITPFTFKREGQGYNDDTPDILHTKGFPSASALRKTVRLENFDYFQYLYDTLSSACSLPPDIKMSLQEFISPIQPVYADDLSELLNLRLLEITLGLPEDEAAKALSSYSDLSADLAGRLSHQILSFDTFTGRAAALKSRSYTYARVSRALLHTVLGITDDDVSLAKKNDYVSYARVLGFRRSSADLLRAIHQSSDLPLMTKTAGAAESLGADGRRCLSEDLYASHLYQSLVFTKSGVRLPNEYTRPLIIIGYSNS